MASAPLTANQIAGLSKAGVHRVDRGLYVQVRPDGSRSWILRFRLHGRARAMGLGSLHLVPLTEARAKAIRAQRLLLDGQDPIEARRADRKTETLRTLTPTFASCAREYIKSQKAAWSNAKHAYQWLQSLETYAFPSIGNLPVEEVTVDLVLQVLKPIWTTKSETAGRIRGRIEKILGWAEAHGHRSGPNPAAWKGPLGHMLPPLSKVQTVRHHPALPYDDIGTLVRELAARDGESARALRFLILTASRSGEVRGARWSEIDLASRVWTVPAERMKSRKEHRVPLTDAAIALLLLGERRPDDLVFPGSGHGRPLSDMSLIALVRKLRGAGSTVHGLRSSFRDWAAEQTDYPREVVEACLAHTVGSEVELAYKRTDFFEKRSRLMNAWANHCVREPSTT